MNPIIGYVVRSLGTGLFLANGVLIAAAGTGDIDSKSLIIAALTGIQGALTYAGIGAAVPQIEPKIGNKGTTRR